MPRKKNVPGTHSLFPDGGDASSAPEERAKAPDLRRETAGERLRALAASLHGQIERGRRPTLAVPLRALSNVTFSPRKGYFVIGDRVARRTLSYQTVRSFAQTVRLMAFAKHLIDTGDFASKREVYYTSKGSKKRSVAGDRGQAGWGPAGFDHQDESDTIMDDIEAMASVNREQLGFIPAEQNGSVAGALIVIDIDPSTGKRIEIDCTAFGRGSYSIPSRVEGLEFRTRASFILAVETAALFERLNGHAYWRKANCIVIAMGGVPTRANRRFVRILSDQCDLPVYVFTDGDPYGYGNIYRTMKVGSGNAAAVNEFFCVPRAHLIGVTPQDIEDYDLPTHPLDDKDRKRALDAIRNDPFIQKHKEWVDALRKMLDMGVRVEQQAFAARGLNYVMDTYLPEKLRAPEKMLP
ncbi:MAG: DNA topoisomerase IV subunit A [Deltaproteobacteria bacterium]|nr:DNA topoisomerase IV subunit A [Deltaproteobacteria bacterium]